MFGGVVHRLVHEHPARYGDLFTAVRDPGDDLVAGELCACKEFGVGNLHGGREGCEIGDGGGKLALLGARLAMESLRVVLGGGHQVMGNPSNAPFRTGRGEDERISRECCKHREHLSVRPGHVLQGAVEGGVCHGGRIAERDRVGLASERSPQSENDGREGNRSERRDQDADLRSAE